MLKSSLLHPLGWALFGAAVSATSMMWAVIFWTLFVMVWLVALTGPVSGYLIGRKWRWVGMLPILVGLACGLLGAIGSRIALTSHRQERAAVEKKTASEAELIASLAAAKAEAAQANQRADRMEARDIRRADKFTRVAKLIGDAINLGDGYRYALDAALLRHLSANTFPQFNEEFDKTDHAKHIEQWRGATAEMLDRELPGLGFGSAFSGIDGTRNTGRPGFRLSQVIHCMDYLRTLQSNLPSTIAQIVQ